MKSHDVARMAMRRGYTHSQTDRAQKLAGQGLDRDAIVAAVEVCQWFARCTRPATTRVDHPVLGNVDCCEPCAAFASGDD